MVVVPKNVISSKKARKPSWIDTETPYEIFGFPVGESLPQHVTTAVDGKGWYIEVEKKLNWKSIHHGVFGKEVILDGEGRRTIVATTSTTAGADNNVSVSVKTLPKNLSPKQRELARYQTSSVFGFIVDDGSEEKSEKASSAATTIQLWFKRTYIEWALRERKERNERLETMKHEGIK